MTEENAKRKRLHENLRKFYDSEYYAGSQGSSVLPWHMKMVANRLVLRPGTKVLDVACGTGEWLEELKNHGADIAGVDISERAISHALERLPDATLKRSTAEDLPFESGQFDLVTCLGSLEHFIDQPKSLLEMRRVAADGARVLILVPNAGFLTRRLGLYQGTQQVRIRETVRTIAEWKEMINGAGLAPVALWRDLHMLSIQWLRKGPVINYPLRVLQALALTVWPIAWQYQVYFLCRKNNSKELQS